MPDTSQLIGLLVFVVILVIFIIIIVFVFNTLTGSCVDEIDCTLLSKQVLVPPSEGKVLDRLEMNYIAMIGGDSNYNFGRSMSSSGRYYFVSNSRAYTGPVVDERGEVYIYYRENDDTLTHIQTLSEQEFRTVSGDGSPGAFGESVSAYGDLLVVSAPFFSDPSGLIAFSDAGCVYVFRRKNGQYVLQQRIFNNNISVLIFGLNIVLKGIHLIIGRGGLFSTSIEYYTYDSTDDHFKHVQSIDDGFPLASTEITSIDLDEINGRLAYSRCIFNGDSDGAVITYDLVAGMWANQQVLNPVVAANGGYFGFSISMERGYLAIGQGGSIAGTAAPTGDVDIYVHDGVSWVFDQALTDPRIDHGLSVFLLGDVLFVGVPDLDDPDLLGSVMVYKRNDLGSYVFIEEKYHDSLYPGTHLGYKLYADEYLLIASSSSNPNFNIFPFNESVYTFVLDRTFVQVAC